MLFKLISSAGTGFSYIGKSIPSSSIYRREEHQARGKKDDVEKVRPYRESVRALHRAEA
jgi:hypothetical protein